MPLASLDLSGGVKNTLAMAAAVASAGHSVTVIAPDFGPAPAFPVSGNVRLRVLRTPRLPRTLRRVAYYARLVGTSATGFDLCLLPYSLTVHAAWLSSLLHGGRCRVLYVVSAYEPETHGALAESSSAGRLLRRGLATLSYRLPVQKVYVSRWLARRAGDPHGSTISLGLDHEIFHPHGRRPAAGPRVGVIARRGRVKGYADFLAAWRLLERPPSLTVVRVDAVEVPVGATVLGRLSPREIADFYRSADIFVFSSLSEGFPAPPLEAMACGAAVVATRSGGIEEYAVDGANAVLVPVSDPSALARAIERLSADRDLRDRLVAAGLRTAAGYRAEHTAAATVRLVEEVSGSR